MTNLRAVIEMGLMADEDAPWPVEEAGDFRYEVLDAETGPKVIGSLMAAVAAWCRPEDADDEHIPTAAEALGWIAASDYVVISAGIQVSSPTAQINPGCCCELNDWHGWSDRARRPEMWLGHSPQPWIEETPTGIAVHPDKDEPDRDPILISATELPALLAELQTDLIAVLAAIERWATEVSGDPQLAAAVVANIDRQVGISAEMAA